MITEPILICQLHGEVAASPTVPYKYPHCWKLDNLLHVLWSCVEILYGLSIWPAFPCMGYVEELHAYRLTTQRQNTADVTLRILGCDFLKRNLLRLFFPFMGTHLWNNFRNKKGNGLMTNSCFTHNFSGMPQTHPGKLGCTLRLALWHGFCGAKWGWSFGWKPCHT